MVETVAHVPLKGESHCCPVDSCFYVAVWSYAANLFIWGREEAENPAFPVTSDFKMLVTFAFF